MGEPLKHTFSFPIFLAHGAFKLKYLKQNVSQPIVFFSFLENINYMLSNALRHIYLKIRLIYAI